MASVNSNAAQAQPQAIKSMPARSSWIALFEYDPAQMRLTTHLKDGSIYQHTFVLPLEWAQLQTAHSHGSHYAKNIQGKKLGIRVKSAKAPKSQMEKRK